LNWANTGGRIEDRIPVEKLMLGEFLTDLSLVDENYYPDMQNIATAFTVIVGEDQPPAANVVPQAKFRVGDSILREGSAKHCNFAGDDCWYVRVLPKIDAIDKKFGLTSGGQELIITG
jgi:hypothetical protein